jgi:hypothetical protein
VQFPNSVVRKHGFDPYRSCDSGGASLIFQALSS